MNSTVPIKTDGISALNASEVNEMNQAINSKQDAVLGKGLSTNDYTTPEKSKLTGIATGATVNASDSALRDRATHTGTQPASSIANLGEVIRNTAADMIVNGTHTNVSVLYNEDEDTLSFSASGGGGGGGGTVDAVPTNNSTNAVSSNGVFDALELKVDKDGNKVLSEENYTAAEKAKLNGISPNATANFSNAVLLDRANHTGTMSADYVTDGINNKSFTAAERAKLTDIATGATANQSDSFLTDLANSTGVLSADKITDGTNNKAFTVADRDKLSAVATGATANSSDAQLRDRATHTGVQPASSISDFTEAAQEAVVAMIQAGTHTNISFTYNDAANSLSASASGGGGGGGGTIDPVPTDGSTNAVSSNGAFDALALKVDKDGSKVLTDVNFSAALNTKLASIATAATANATDAQLRDRATHTGVQPAASIEEDGTHRFVTDAEKGTWNAKAPTVSPIFTGSVVVPAPSAGNQATNRDYVTTALNDALASGGGNSAVVLTTVAALRNILSPSTSLLYYTLDAGKEGLWRYDDTDASTGDDGGIVIVSTNGKRYKRIIVNKEVYLKWYTGATNYTPIFSSLFQQEYYVFGEPNATYVCNSGINKEDVDVFFDGRGCRIHFSESTDYFMEHNVTNTTWYNVTSISYSTADLGYTTIVVAGVLAAGHGDVIKLFSPTELIAGTTKSMRKGEFLTPLRVTNDGVNTTILVRRTLMETYIIAEARVAVVRKVTVKFKNVTMRSLNEDVNVGGGFYFRGSFEVDMQNVTFETLDWPAINCRGCFSPSFDRIRIYNVQYSDFGPGAATGAGIQDNGCFGMKVSNCTFHSLRFGYMTGGSGSTTDYNYFGETSGAMISSCTAKGCSYPFTTAHEGANITFQACYVENSAVAYQMIARGTRLIGCVGYQCGTGILINVTEAGHREDMFVIRGCTIDGVTTAPLLINGSVVRKVEVSDCLFNGYVQMGFANVDMSSCHITSTGDTQAFILRDGQYNLRNMKIDCGNDSWYTILIDGNTKVYADNFQITATGTNNPTIANLRNSVGTAEANLNNYLVAKNFTFTFNSGPNQNHSTPTFPVVNATQFQVLRLQWKTENFLLGSPSTENSMYLNVAPRATGGALEFDNKYLLDEHLFALVSGFSTARDISTYVFSNGTSVGQKMTIENKATATLTLPALNLSAPKVLAVGSLTTIVWNGAGWRYVNA